MKKVLLLISVFLGLMAFALPAQALTFEYNFEFSEAFAPVGDAPWLTATFENIDINTVGLTLEATNLTGSECVSGWYFNLDTGLDADDLLNLSINNKGGPNASISKGIDTYKADGDGYFDILLDFDKTFVKDSVATFEIYFTGGLTDLSFDFMSAPSGNSHGPFLSAAHVQSIGSDDEKSGWVAPVPEPATMLLLGFGLVGIAAVGRKKFRTS